MTRDALADRDVADRRARPLRPAGARSRGSRRGSRSPVAWPKPKRLIQRWMPSRPSFSRERDRADVRRVRRGSARPIIVSVAALLGVVDDAVGDVDLVRQRERRRRRDEPLREHAGDRHELEGRARLVHVGDGAVARAVDAAPGRSGSRRSPARPPSRAPRPCCGSSTIAVAALRAPLRHGLAQHRLGLAPGSCGRASGGRRGRVAPAAATHVDHAPERVADDRLAARTGRRAPCRATARARRARCCRRPRSRAPARRPTAAGTCAAPPDRSRGRRAPLSASARGLRRVGLARDVDEALAPGRRA